MKKAVKIFDCVVSVLMLFVFTFVAIGIEVLPSQVNILGKETLNFNSIYSAKANLNHRGSGDIAASSVTYASMAQIKLFGIIPVKDTRIVDSKRRFVVPGGENFGIKLHTQGVIVVGTGAIDTDNGSSDPASDAGIHVGDIIVEMSGIKVNTTEEVQEAIRNCGGNPIGIKLKREDQYMNTVLLPIIAAGSETYKAGVWIRDSTAGVGTVTFYNTANSTFAGLGHPINDIDTNELMPLLSGEAVKAKVTGVFKSVSGEAGSLCCSFTSDSIGGLICNIENGIYGNCILKLEESDAIPVATSQEIEKGNAQIISTIESGEKQFYDIEIERINYSNDSELKNLVIKITDPELLEKTGGIVQGMSGSPIIQNGKLVGAVTHVFVNNPTKGYGIFAENMVETSDGLNK